MTEPTRTELVAQVAELRERLGRSQDKAVQFMNERDMALLDLANARDLNAALRHDLEAIHDDMTGEEADEVSRLSHDLGEGGPVEPLENALPEDMTEQEALERLQGLLVSTEGGLRETRDAVLAQVERIERALERSRAFKLDPVVDKAAVLTACEKIKELMG